MGFLEDMLAISLSLSMSPQQITETINRLYKEKNNTSIVLPAGELRWASGADTNKDGRHVEASSRFTKPES